MVAAGIAIDCIVALVAVGVYLVHLAQELGADTGIFGSSEAMLQGPLHLAVRSGEGFLVLTLLGYDTQGEGSLGMSQEERTVAHPRIEEGAVGLLRHLAETTVEHTDYHVLGIFAQDI